VEGNRLVGIVTATDVFDALGSAATHTLSRAERQLLRAPSRSKRLGGQPDVSRRPHVRVKCGANLRAQRRRGCRLSWVRHE
jgi:hypothetical protein